MTASIPQRATHDGGFVHAIKPPFSTNRLKSLCRLRRNARPAMGVAVSMYGKEG